MFVFKFHYAFSSFGTVCEQLKSEPSGPALICGNGTAASVYRLAPHHFSIVVVHRSTSSSGDFNGIKGIISRDFGILFLFHWIDLKIVIGPDKVYFSFK
jgi:hypothetical protein